MFVVVVVGSAFQVVAFAHESFGYMAVKWHPVVDRLAFLVMLVVNMTKSLFPCIQPFRLEFDNLSAEAAPEFALSIPSDAVPLTLCLDVFIIVDVVFVAKVSLKLLAPVEDAGTLSNRTGFGILVATPGLNLIMLGVFVAFPIILASELLGAAWKRATVGTGMPF